MFMTYYEIAFSYKTARIRSQQITVLAELNNVPVPEMQKKLVSMGFTEAAQILKRRGGRLPKAARRTSPARRVSGASRTRKTPPDPYAED